MNKLTFADQITQNCPVDLKVLSELVAHFLECTPLLLVELRQAAIHGDKDLSYKASFIKLSCLDIGAKRMAGLLHIIEQGQTSLNSTLQLIDGLEDEFMDVYNELLRYSSWNPDAETEI